MGVTEEVKKEKLGVGWGIRDRIKRFKGLAWGCVGGGVNGYWRLEIMGLELGRVETNESGFLSYITEFPELAFVAL